VIEALRKTPDRYNNLLVSNTPSSILIQQLPSWHIEDYRNMIVDESKEFYDKLLEHFTNNIMDNPAIFKKIPLESDLPNQPNKSNTYTIEESEFMILVKTMLLIDY
jgi:hypothetical protein